MEEGQAKKLQIELVTRIYVNRPLREIQPLIESGRMESNRLHPYIANGIVAAAGKGRSDLLALFLAYPTERRDLNEALLRACSNWHPNVVETLLQAGADVQARNPEGQTPLIALGKGLWQGRDSDKGLAAARSLVEHGADLNAVDTDRSSALNTLLNRTERTYPLVSYLIAAGAKVGPVEAALLGDAEGLEVLLTQPGNRRKLLAKWPQWIDRVAKDGYLDVLRILILLVGEGRSLLVECCLSPAIYSGHAEMVRFLLQYGNAPTPYYAREYLVAAIRHGHTAMIRFLLDELGLDIHTRGIGPSFRHACYHNTHPEAVALLLERADQECLVKWKLSEALGSAAEGGRIEIVKLLLAYGAQVNRFHDGHTPLMCAVRSGHVEVARLLLEAGANKQAKANLQGQLYSVSGYAQAGGNAEILQMLQ